ncbi:serine/threonine-protein kinase [Chondromyces apiculatus]|uniref:non-specific serine/threonine protein kinase n=1 Tax=Chondromyces apiculatus DSM 436 TaxID=1192034 RepID=A0A017T2S1_9BACT|nr:serine/threonine-protein kinase [Chondromyces apiculatus]EYF03529.1 Hypothetical protein CAP_5513 [Chondromyces apiculatus DSM 436]
MTPIVPSSRRNAPPLAGDRQARGWRQGSRPEASAPSLRLSGQAPRPVGAGEFKGSSRYELLLKLASGGSASVYVGRVTGSAGFSRLVAVKRAHPHLSHDPAVRKMMGTEARLASGLNHANVVAVQDVERVGSELLLILDYVEGASLSELLSAGTHADKPLPARVAMRIAIDACTGLAAVHEIEGRDGMPIGFLHRDVSPQNILVGLDGTTRITDFGLAKHICNDASKASGMLQGKLAYLAPEIIDRATFSVQSDLFAMAVVVWESMARRRLFQGDTWADTVRKVGLVQPPPLSAIVPGLDTRIDRIMARALDKEAAQRHATVRAFVQELEALGAERHLIATNSEVSAYVESVVGESLRRRRALIRPFQPVDGEELMTTQDFHALPCPLRSSGEAPAIPPRPTPPPVFARAAASHVAEVQPPSSGITPPSAPAFGHLPRTTPPPARGPLPRTTPPPALGSLPRTTPPPSLGPLPHTTPPPAPDMPQAPWRTAPPLSTLPSWAPPSPAGTIKPRRELATSPLSMSVLSAIPRAPALPDDLLGAIPVVAELDDEESTMNTTPLPAMQVPVLAAPLPPAPPPRHEVPLFPAGHRSRQHAPPAVVSGSLLRRPLRQASPPQDVDAWASIEVEEDLAEDMDEDDLKATAVQQSPWATSSSDPLSPWVPPTVPPARPRAARRGAGAIIAASVTMVVGAGLAMAALHGPLDLRALPGWAAQLAGGRGGMTEQGVQQPGAGAPAAAGRPASAGAPVAAKSAARVEQGQAGAVRNGAAAAGKQGALVPQGGVAAAPTAPTPVLTPEGLPDAVPGATRKNTSSGRAGRALTPDALPDVKRRGR